MAIGCESCNRLLRNDETSNHWTTSARSPYEYTYHVCQACFKSLRQPWFERFKLLERASIGHGHYDRNTVIQEISAEVGCRPPADTQSTEAGIDHNPCDIRDPKPFEYSPVGTNDIRVITIVPGSGDICCHIEVNNFEKYTADFAALSYCWGSSESVQEKHTIWIGGRKFHILKNLFDAMQELRHPTKERRLWIDAICINQADISEKEKQIPLMDRIYNQALGVIVWLGPCSHDSDFVMGVIERGDLEQMNTDRFVFGIAKLCSRPWFSRTWIVQEFVLGRPRIFCGSRNVSASKFLATAFFLGDFLQARHYDATRTTEQLNWDASSHWPVSMYSERVVSWAAREELGKNKALANLSDLRRMVLDHDGNVNPRNLALILRKCGNFDATSLRDKIYGTLGLVKQSVFRHIQIDYGEIMSDADVYLNAMAYMIGIENDIEAVALFVLLPMPLSTPQSMPNLPSWVPDFSSKTPVLVDVGVMTWFMMYHMNAVEHRNRPILRLQHGRHILSRDTVEATIQNRRLITFGFLADEIDFLVSSTFFSSRMVAKEHIRRGAEGATSGSERLSHEGWQLLRSLDDRLDDIMESDDLSKFCETEESAEITRLALKLNNILRYMTIILVDAACRQKFTEIGIGVSENEWITSIWIDLLEGYPLLQDLTKDDLISQFLDMAGSPVPMATTDWLLEAGSHQTSSTKRNYKEETYQLQVAIQSLFSDGRKFFVTKSTGLYGIGMPSIKKGDKLAFLFPPIYMAFILRPFEDHYQIVAPAIVPPKLRTKYMSQQLSSGSAPQSITIV